MSKVMIIIILCGTFLLSVSHAEESEDQRLKAWDFHSTKKFSWNWDLWTSLIPKFTTPEPTWDDSSNSGYDPEQRLKAWDNDTSWKNIFILSNFNYHVTREPVNLNSIIWKLFPWKSPTNNPLMRKLSTRYPTARKSTTWRPATRMTTTWRPATRKTTTWRPATRMTTTWRPATRKTTTWRPWNPPTWNPFTNKPPTWNPFTKKPSTRRPSNWNENYTSGSDGNAFIIIIISIVVFVVIAVVVFSLAKKGAFSSCSL